jgi:hypothetical protein
MSQPHKRFRFTIEDVLPVVAERLSQAHDELSQFITPQTLAAVKVNGALVKITTALDQAINQCADAITLNGRIDHGHQKVNADAVAEAWRSAAVLGLGFALAVDIIEQTEKEFGRAAKEGEDAMDEIRKRRFEKPTTPASSTEPPPPPVVPSPPPAEPPSPPDPPFIPVVNPPVVPPPTPPTPSTEPAAPVVPPAAEPVPVIPVIPVVPVVKPPIVQVAVSDPPTVPLGGEPVKKGRR